MTFLVFVLLLLAFIGFVCWLGSGPLTNPQAPDTALGNPGGVGRDYGRLTEQELSAHEEVLREILDASAEALRDAEHDR